MWKVTFGILTLLASMSAARADQWDYLLSYPNSVNPGYSVFNTGMVQTRMAACAQPNLEIVPGLFSDCASGVPSQAISPYVNIDQFASERDMTSLQTSFATLSAQFAASSAQFSQALQLQARVTNSGVAQALAMAGTADLQSDENYAVAFNVGTFGGQTAFAAGAVARVDDHVSVNAGFTAGTNGGPVGARAGIRFGW